MKPVFIVLGFKEIVRFAAIILTAALLVSCNPDEEELKQVMTAGDNIVAALSRFHEENKEHPRSLDELVPNYIEKLPLFDFGARGFSYFRTKKERQKKEGFHLAYIVYPEGLFLLTAHSLGVLEYDPKRCVVNSDDVVVIDRYVDWVLVQQKMK